MANAAAVSRKGHAALQNPVAIGLVLALTLAGCGERNPVNPNPQPTPTPTVARANVVITLGGIRIDFDKVPGFFYALVFNLRVNESAGLAANIDFIRLEMFLPNGTLLERTQIAASAVPGGARLSASGVRDFPALPVGFNSDPLTGRYIIVSVGTTDDRGNVQIASSGQLIFG